MACVSGMVALLWLCLCLLCWCCTKGEGELPDFALALQRAQEVSNLVYQRFEYGKADKYLFFLYAANMPSWGWDILKLKFAIKMLSSKKGGVGSENKSRFLMIFGGSSVTAGHDNFFNQSYPMVLERRLRPIYEALGITLEVRNIAQGANNCLPSNFCYEAMGGDDADWIGWEQSFNCGRSNGIYELMMRVAYWNKAVLYLSASGGIIPNDCSSKSNDSIPWIDEEWRPEKADAGFIDLEKDKYVPTQATCEELKKTLHDSYMEGNSVGRFTAPMWPHYNGVAPHGFSFFAKGPKGDVGNFRGPCYAAGGSHWLTLEAATYAKGHGKSWHPTVGMHLVRGEVLAYNHAHILIDALSMVQKDLQTSSAGDATKSKVDADTLIARYQQQLDALQTPYPKKPLYCGEDCDYRPLCYTDYQPNYNPKYLLNSIFVGTTPPKNSWKVVFKPGANGANPLESSAWGYLDTRPCFEVHGPGHAIHFKITIRNQTYIKVCSYDNKEGLRPALFFLDPHRDDLFTSSSSTLTSSTADASSAVNSSSPSSSSSSSLSTPLTTTWSSPLPESPSPYIASDKAYLLTKRKYSNDECHLVHIDVRGQHVFTVSTNPNATNHYYTVSHIIQWSDQREEK